MDCPVCQGEHETPDIVEFVTSPCFLGPDEEISPAQLSVLKAAYGLEMTQREAVAFASMTEGRPPRPGGYTEIWILVGRRSGKTDKILANVAAYEIFTFDSAVLAAGEKAYFPIVAQDLEGAARARAYVEGKLLALQGKGWDILDQGAAQSRAVTNKEIRTTTGVTVKCFPPSKAAVRGMTAISYGTDESAFWETKDGSYNPDSEVFRALRPTTASIKRAKKVNVTSPYAEEGEAWKAYSKRATSRALVVNAPTWVFHPNIDRRFLEEEEFNDPTAYRREYGAQFGRESGTYLTKDEVENSFDTTRPFVLPPADGIEYVGTIDVGFKHDLYVQTVSHLAAGVIVFDFIGWWQGTKKEPLDGQAIAREASEVFGAYAIDVILADQYCDVQVKKDYNEFGVTVETENMTDAANFEEAKAMKAALRRGLIRLPEHETIRRDLLSVKRLGGGKYPKLEAPERVGFHDDIFRACCKAVMKHLPTVAVVDLDELNQGATRRAGLSEVGGQMMEQLRKRNAEDDGMKGEIMGEVY